LNEAETTFVEVIEAMSKVLGAEHSQTLRTIASLAGIYAVQGRLKEEEELFLKVREGRANVLGDEHPETLYAIANLARIRELSAQV
jgi:hypothetical protein